MMPERPAVERIEQLEQRVELLEALPARVMAVELQLRQLRGLMLDEFSTIRGEMHAMSEALQAEMHALHHLTIERIDAGDAETRRHMRVLVEEVLARIETIGEGRKTRKKR